MKKLHLSLSVRSIPESVTDYTQRLGVPPTLVIEDTYALWRTDTLNVSLRCKPENAGRLRHLGWEDASAPCFTSSVDVNGIEWEHFSADQQAAEIRHYWPQSMYKSAS